MDIYDVAGNLIGRTGPSGGGCLFAVFAFVAIVCGVPLVIVLPSWWSWTVLTAGLQHHASSQDMMGAVIVTTACTFVSLAWTAIVVSLIVVIIKKIRKRNR